MTCIDITIFNSIYTFFRIGKSNIIIIHDLFGISLKKEKKTAQLIDFMLINCRYTNGTSGR